MEFKLASEFTNAPGGRYKAHGPASGEELREDHLIPRLTDAKDGLVIDLDGMLGMPPSFAEEAFGGLVRRLGPTVLGRVTFRSTEDHRDVEEIEGFMRAAAERDCG